MKDPKIIDPDQPPEAASASVASSLLVRLRGQDADAWRRLTALYGRVVYDWCRKAGLQAEDAADVGQEVFHAVARHLVDFRRQRAGDSFRGWLWTIAHNKIRDFWRRQAALPRAVGGSSAHQRLLQVAQDESADSAVRPPSADESAGLFHRALELMRAEFEERTWTAFWRVAVEDRVPADVAAELGMSAASVYAAKSRVLRRLREELGDLLD
jgi:RNA polymerase sigma-70 factor (ECF subfamily)